MNSQVKVLLLSRNHMYETPVKIFYSSQGNGFGGNLYLNTQTVIHRRIGSRITSFKMFSVLLCLNTKARNASITVPPPPAINFTPNLLLSFSPLNFLVPQQKLYRGGDV